jgi:hypothetical protein
LAGLPTLVEFAEANGTRPGQEFLIRSDGWVVAAVNAFLASPRMTSRHGRQSAADAVAEAAHITALWARHGFHDDRRKPLIHAFLGHNPLTGRLPSGDPITPVVTYPETIDLARVLTMPRWRHPSALASKHEVPQFRCDVNHHLAIDYQPQDSPNDPLFRWFRKRHAPQHRLDHTIAAARSGQEPIPCPNDRPRTAPRCCSWTSMERCCPMAEHRSRQPREAGTTGRTCPIRSWRSSSPRTVRVCGRCPAT